jgi:transcriptional regulator with XRE-family HTH domain
MDYNKERNDKIWEEFSAGSGTDANFIQKQMDIAAQIDTYLKEKGWTQRQLAEKSGLRPSQLSTILSGNANPTLRTISNIEEALGCDVIVCPEFYEESLVSNGWSRPNDMISLHVRSYTRYTKQDEAEIRITDTWESQFDIGSQHYETASGASHHRPTG